MNSHPSGAIIQPIWQEIEAALQEEISFDLISLRFSSKRWEKIYQKQRNTQRRKVFPFMLAYFGVLSVFRGFQFHYSDNLYESACYFGTLLSLLTLGMLQMQWKSFLIQTQQVIMMNYVILALWCCFIDIMRYGICLESIDSASMIMGFFYTAPLLIAVVLDVSFVILTAGQLVLSLVWGCLVLSANVRKSDKGFLLMELMLNLFVTVAGAYAILRLARHRFLDMVLFKREKFVRVKENAAVKGKMISVKKRYIATVAHDIGTPLSAFTNCLDALKQSLVLKQHLELIFMAECAVELLQVLRREVLDYNSTGDGTELCPNLKKVDLLELLAKCSRVLKVAGSYSDLLIEVYRDPQLPSHIISDEDWVWSMLLVLLSNARKFGVRGTNKVFIYLTQGGQQVRVEVADEGIGVPPKKRDILFKPFSKAHRDMGGLGLGLHSLYTRAVMLGGEAGMRENPLSRTGSIFWFQIPVVSSIGISFPQKRGSPKDTPTPSLSLGSSWGLAPMNPSVLLIGSWRLSSLCLFRHYCQWQDLKVEEVPSIDTFLSTRSLARKYGAVFCMIETEKAENKDTVLHDMHQELCNHFSRNGDARQAPPFVCFFTKQLESDEAEINSITVKRKSSVQDSKKRNRDKAPNNRILPLLELDNHSVKPNKAAKAQASRSMVAKKCEKKKSFVPNGFNTQNSPRQRDSSDLSFSFFGMEDSEPKDDGPDTFFPKIPAGIRTIKYKHSTSDSLIESADFTGSHKKTGSSSSLSIKDGFGVYSKIIYKPVDGADLIIILMSCISFRHQHLIDIDASLNHAMMAESKSSNPFAISPRMSIPEEAMLQPKPVPGVMESLGDRSAPKPQDFCIMTSSSEADLLSSKLLRRETDAVCAPRKDSISSLGVPEMKNQGFISCNNNTNSQSIKNSPLKSMGLPPPFPKSLNSLRLKGSECLESLSKSRRNSFVALLDCDENENDNNAAEFEPTPTEEEHANRQSLSLVSNNIMSTPEHSAKHSFHSAIETQYEHLKTMCPGAEDDKAEETLRIDEHNMEDVSALGQNEPLVACGHSQHSRDKFYVINQGDRITIKHGINSQITSQRVSQENSICTEDEALPRETREHASQLPSFTSPDSTMEKPIDVPKQVLGQNVLVVEDDKITVKLVTRQLIKEDFTVDAAENGRVGLNQMKQNFYRFVLMDWNMPVMDGLKCIQRFREWEKEELKNGNRARRQLIVMFSANAAKDYVEKALKCGADSFVAKPMKISALLKAIASLEATK